MEIRKQQQKRQIAKWFKPAARARVSDTYWDLTKECVKNTSDKMLTVAMADDDDLCWAAEKLAPDLGLPKRKWVQLKEESFNNTISTIKSGMSTKKTQKFALEKSTAKDGQEATKSKDNSQIVASQATSILQLTEQVNEIKQTNKMLTKCS